MFIAKYDYVFKKEREKSLKVKLLTVGFLSIFLLAWAALQYSQYFDGKLHIVFCDVGQGDAIFIRTPKGADIVVDGGPNDKVLGCLSNHMPFWDRDIELIFATHPDADHITGLESVLKNYTVKSFNTSKKSKGTKVFARIQSLIEAKKIPFRYVYSGDKFSLSDNVLIETFWPSHEHVESDTGGKLDANSFSLVQTINFGQFKALLTGDIEYQILDTLFNQGLEIDIFKLPHHGSKTGVDEMTFELIKPGLSIISAGKNNRYHHPHPSVLEFLKKYNLSYKNTISDGEIEIVSDGTRFEYKVQRVGP